MTFNILVIFTGGTIGSSAGDGYVAPDEHKKYQLLELYKKRAKDDVEFKTISPYQVLSENTTFGTYQMLYECLKNIEFDKYDGVIITHGTDTIQYTSAFAGYMLNGIRVPVVFVSANYILDDVRSNGVDNFYYAVRFICSQAGKGVFVSYKNEGDTPKIHRATRLLAHEVHSDEIYSVCNQIYGYFQDDKFVMGNIKDREAAEKDYEKVNFEPVQEDWKPGVLQIYPSVGMTYPKLTKDIKAVLHHTYHSGTICSHGEDLQNFAKEAKELQIPVFVVGRGLGTDYESIKIFEDAGFIELPVCTPIASYIKLCLCTICGYDREKMTEVMMRNIADDIVMP